MSDGTKIEWTDATANYVNGCSVVSPGCTNCYAMRLAGTRLQHHPSREGLTIATKAGPVWNGTVRANDAVLKQVLGWKRPRSIFWNAHGDLFHPSVPFEWVDRQFAAMALTPQHIHQVLTKRPGRMATYVTALVSGERSIWDHARQFVGEAAASGVVAQLIMDLGWGRYSHAPRKPLPNVWLGVSAEDQERWDDRVDTLRKVPAAVRFVSAEPLLGLVRDDFGMDRLDWVIVGGESGPGARPMHPDWARSLRDQCAAADVAFHFKQWGAWAACEDNSGYWPPDAERFCLLDSKGRRGHLDGWPMQLVGKKAAGRLLDGVEHNGVPA